MIGRAEIADAYTRVRPHVRRTPVLTVEAGGLGVDLPVVLKLEQLQLTGSFKARGAFNNMLGGVIPPAGVVAVSGGNHGAAVALAATRLGAGSVVFVPAEIANAVKIDRMRGFGAEVVVVEGSVDSAIEAYEDHARKTGALAIHPYGSPETIAGQGTLGPEIEEQAPGLDTLLVAVGGGGLIGGIAAWFGGRVRIVAVETEGTSSLDKTLRGTLPAGFRVSGISASGLGASSIGPLALEIIRAHVAENVVVADEDVREAQRRLWQATRLVCEPGGVTSLAALTSGAYRPGPDERVGVLLCGGNADPGWFADKT